MCLHKQHLKVEVTQDGSTRLGVICETGAPAPKCLDLLTPIINELTTKQGGQHEERGIKSNR